MAAKGKLKKAKKKSLISKGHSDWISEKRITKKEVEKRIDDIDIDKLDQEVLSDHEIKYPPPSRHSIFRKKWKEFLPILMERPNFNPTVLSQLEILCDLYVEYDECKSYIDEHGYTYEAYGRQGKAVKQFPQVNQMNIVKKEIANYSKMLELTVNKMKKLKAEEKDEWK